MRLRLTVAFLFLGCATMKEAFRDHDAADGFQQRLALIKKRYVGGTKISPSYSAGIGRVKRDGTSLVALERYGQAQGRSLARDGITMRFHSLANGQICFEKDVSRNPEREAAKAYGDAPPPPTIDMLKAEAPTVEAFTALSALPSRSTYVPASGVVLANVTVVADETHTEVTRVNLENQYDKVQSGTYRLCGNAPSITAQTRYITVSEPQFGRDPDEVELYLWAVTEDAPAPDGAMPPLQLDF
jgi:hypothetical protein